MPNAENHGGVRPGGAPDGALCRRCNYPLRGLPSDRCPECGQEFDPGNPATMLARPLGRIGRLFSRPPGILVNGAACVLGLLTVASTSAPDWYFNFAMLVFMGWITLGLYWIVRLIGFWIVFVRRGTVPTSERTLRRWVTGPIVACFTILIGFSRLPEMVALWISRPAMDRLAAQRFQDPTSLPRCGWIGLFPAEDIEAVPGGVRFLVRGSGFMGRRGYAYFENGVYQGRESWRGNEEPLSGLWFRWTKSMGAFF